MRLTIKQLKRIIKEAIQTPKKAVALLIDNEVKALFANQLSADLFQDKLVDAKIDINRISSRDVPVTIPILDGQSADVEKFLKDNQISLKEAIHARYKATVRRNKLYISILRS